jgi:cytochrome c biogenesis factor
MTREHTVALRDAEIFRSSDPFGHRWQFSSQGVSTLQRENYASLTVSLLARRDDVPMPMLSAEARSYGLASGKESGLPAFITGKLSGLFMETRLTITAPDGQRPTLRIAFVPLASWVVVGAWLVAVGTLLSLAPARTEASA